MSRRTGTGLCEVARYLRSRFRLLLEIIVRHDNSGLSFNLKFKWAGCCPIRLLRSSPNMTHVIRPGASLESVALGLKLKDAATALKQASMHPVACG